MISVVIQSLSAGQYKLSIDGGLRQWDVTRSLEDFNKLLLDLKAQNLLVDVELNVTVEDSSLQSFMDAVLASVEERIWKTTTLLRFLDNVAERSYIAELQLQYLAEQIDSLNKKTTDLEKIQAKMQSTFSQFNDSLKGYGTVLHRGNRHYSGRHSSNETPNKDLIPEDVSSGDQNEANHRESVISNSTFDDETSSNRSPIVSGEYSIFNQSSRNSAEMTERRGSFTKAVLPKSQYMEEELLPLGEKSSLFDSTISSLLEIVGPTEQQMQHRLSIIALLKRLIRLSLGVSVFEIGIPATRCILPDDPVRLMVTLPKSAVATWHTQLCEYLTNFAEKASAYGGSNYVPVDEDEMLDPYFNDSTVLKNHFIGNITHMKQNLSHMVQLLIDSVPIEIIANNRTDLCMIGFFEEISNLVDQNYLFKRSFLLVRAWWCYETPAFVGCVIRHYLTDYQLFVMIAAIFNQYSQFITTPFQALCIFLLEYSSYDGNSQAISIFGIINFQTKASNQPVIPDVRPYHLIKTDLLDKYWQIFNVTQTQDSEQAIHKKRSSSSEDPISEPKNDNSSDDVVVLERNQIIDALKTFSAANLHFFDRSSFNIVHPLNHTNMIVEKLSQRRISRLARAFQIGATNLSFFLKRCREEGAIEAGESIKTYFPNVANYPNPWMKFKEGSMLDVLCYAMPLPKIEYDIRYGDLMIEAIVTDQALLALAMEILAMKGPLPVGEIGKILAELTSIPSLSLKLKEKYGGLKKFLEQYPTQFVVSNDHPFNPNVLLKSSLSQEHLELLEKGIFPHQLLVKAKKISAAGKKKKPHSIPQGTGENSTRHEYHPYTQATLHQSLPRNGDISGKINFGNSVSGSKLSTPPPTSSLGNKMNVLPPSRRVSLNKTAQPFIPTNSNSGTNMYAQGIASDHYHYGAASSEDLYTVSHSHGHYTAPESKSYDSYSNVGSSNPGNTFSPSPSASERNSINYSVAPSPSFGDDYHTTISNSFSNDPSNYSSSYLSQLRAESLEPAQGISHTSSGNYYQDVLGNRGLGSNSINDNNSYHQSQQQSSYSNYPSQRSSGNLSGLTENLGRNFSINASNSHLASAVVGNGLNRRDSGHQAGNFTNASHLLFGDQSSGNRSTVNLGQSQFHGYGQSKEKTTGSVLSNLFPSLLSSSEPASNSLLNTEDSPNTKYRTNFANKFF